MSNNIEVIAAVSLSEAQQKAVRKLALRTSKKSAQDLANDLMAQVIRGRFKAVTENIATDAAAKYDMAVSGGFTPPMERKEYIAKSKAEYAEILSDL